MKRQVSVYSQLSAASRSERREREREREAEECFIAKHSISGYLGSLSFDAGVRRRGQRVQLLQRKVKVRIDIWNV